MRAEIDDMNGRISQDNSVTSMKNQKLEAQGEQQNMVMKLLQSEKAGLEQQLHRAMEKLTAQELELDRLGQDHTAAKQKCQSAIKENKRLFGQCEDQSGLLLALE